MLKRGIPIVFGSGIIGRRKADARKGALINISFKRVARLCFCIGLSLQVMPLYAMERRRSMEKIDVHSKARRRTCWA